MVDTSLFRRVIHLASNIRIKLRVTEVANGLFTILALTLGFSDHFTSDDNADFANSVKFGVESANIDFIGVDCCAESDSRCVDLRCYQYYGVQTGLPLVLTISWVMWIALQRMAPKPIPGKTYMLLSKLAAFLCS